MTLQTVYYIVFIVSVVAEASFKLGYDFIRDYSSSFAFKFVKGNIGYTDGKMTLPHYMAMFI